MSAQAPPRIGLGTVQFGLDYGITNEAGRVPEEEVRSILDLCTAAGIDTLDTAHLYGASEEAIGRNAPPEAGFRIVTKTPKFGGETWPGEAADRLRSAFDGSLTKLGRGEVYGLLLHDAGDLLGPLGGALWEAMEELRASGRVARIGVSVYDGTEIDAALDRYKVDIVQLPWNPIDDRLVAGGQLARLAGSGIEVHARSLFLQGLLLQPVEKIPERFGPLRDAIRDLSECFSAVGLGRLEGILAAAFARPEISRFICGVTSAAELQAIILAARSAERVKGPDQIPTYRGLDPRYLNPARWPELA